MEAPEPPTDPAGQARARSALGLHARAIRGLIYPPDEEPADG
jgi:hypothetical protein